MALISCPECGQQVSDKASACIHCGAPLNVKNGIIKIKCCNIDNNPYKVKVLNAKTGTEIVKIAQKGVASFTIEKDTTVQIKYLLMKPLNVDLKYEGTHCYEITLGNGFLVPKLMINEVTNIDSD